MVLFLRRHGLFLSVYTIFNMTPQWGQFVTYKKKSWLIRGFIDRRFPRMRSWLRGWGVFWWKLVYFFHFYWSTFFFFLQHNWGDRKCKLSFYPEASCGQLRTCYTALKFVFLREISQYLDCLSRNQEGNTCLLAWRL